MPQILLTIFCFAISLVAKSSFSQIKIDSVKKPYALYGSARAGGSGIFGFSASYNPSYYNQMKYQEGSEFFIIKDQGEDENARAVNDKGGFVFFKNEEAAAGDQDQYGIYGITNDRSFKANSKFYYAKIKDAYALQSGGNALSPPKIMMKSGNGEYEFIDSYSNINSVLGNSKLDIFQDSDNSYAVMSNENSSVVYLHDGKGAPLSIAGLPVSCGIGEQADESHVNKSELISFTFGKYDEVNGSANPNDAYFYSPSTNKFYFHNSGKLMDVSVSPLVLVGANGEILSNIIDQENNEIIGSYSDKSDNRNNQVLNYEIDSKVENGKLTRARMLSSMTIKNEESLENGSFSFVFKPASDGSDIFGFSYEIEKGSVVEVNDFTDFSKNAARYAHIFLKDTAASAGTDIITGSGVTDDLYNSFNNLRSLDGMKMNAVNFGRSNIVNLSSEENYLYMSAFIDIAHGATDAKIYFKDAEGDLHKNQSFDDTGLGSFIEITALASEVSNSLILNSDFTIEIKSEVVSVLNSDGSDAPQDLYDAIAYEANLKGGSWFMQSGLKIDVSSDNKMTSTAGDMTVQKSDLVFNFEQFVGKYTSGITVVDSGILDKYSPEDIAVFNASKPVGEFLGNQFKQAITDNEDMINDALDVAFEDIYSFSEYIKETVEYDSYDEFMVNSDIFDNADNVFNPLTNYADFYRVDEFGNLVLNTDTSLGLIKETSNTLSYIYEKQDFSSYRDFIEANSDYQYYNSEALALQDLGGHFGKPYVTTEESSYYLDQMLSAKGAIDMSLGVKMEELSSRKYALMHAVRLSSSSMFSGWNEFDGGGFFGNLLSVLYQFGFVFDQSNFKTSTYLIFGLGGFFGNTLDNISFANGNGFVMEPGLGVSFMPKDFKVKTAFYLEFTIPSLVGYYGFKADNALNPTVTDSAIALGIFLPKLSTGVEVMF